MGSTSCTGRSFSALTHILTQPNKTRSQLRAVRLWEATLSAFGDSRRNTLDLAPSSVTFHLTSPGCSSPRLSVSKDHPGLAGSS
jgi:hypothetical protein